MPRTRRQHKCLRDTYWRAHTSLYSQQFLEATGPTDTYTNTHILLSSEGTGGRCSGGGEGESERDSLCPVRDTPGRTTGTHLSCSRGFQRTHMHHPLLSHGSSVHLGTVRGKAQPLGCGSLNHLPSAGDRSGWGSEVFLTATHGSHIREETQHRVADLMGLEERKPARLTSWGFLHLHTWRSAEWETPALTLGSGLRAKSPT